MALVRHCYTPRDGVLNPVSAKAEFGWLVWSDIIGSPLCGRGEDSAGDNLDRRIPSTSGAWNHGRQACSCGLKKAYVSQDRWILIGATRDGVYAESEANSMG